MGHLLEVLDFAVVQTDFGTRSHQVTANHKWRVHLVPGRTRATGEGVVQDLAVLGFDRNALRVEKRVSGCALVASLVFVVGHAVRDLTGDGQRLALVLEGGVYVYVGGFFALE